MTRRQRRVRAKATRHVTVPTVVQVEFPPVSDPWFIRLWRALNISCRSW